MTFEIPCTDPDSGDAVFIEMVRIHAAAPCLEEGCCPDCLCRLFGQHAGARGLCELEGMVKRMQLDLDLRMVFLGDPVCRRLNIGGDLLILLRIAASLLAGDRHEIADDIGRTPRLDDGEIRRRYRRKAAIGKLHDEIGCHLQRIQSFFRFIARMRRHAMHTDRDTPLARSGKDDGPRLAGGIIYESALRAELGKIILARAFDARFLTDREGHFDGAMRDLLLLHFAKHRKDRRDAADVIACQDRCPVRDDLPFLLLHERNDVPVISHTVHMRREKDRFAVRASGKLCIEIARIAAEHLACLVFRHGEAERRELFLQYVSDRPFITRVDLDRNQFFEFIDDTFLIHGRTPFRKSM